MKPLSHRDHHRLDQFTSSPSHQQPIMPHFWIWVSSQEKGKAICPHAGRVEAGCEFISSLLDIGLWTPATLEVSQVRYRLSGHGYPNSLRETQRSAVSHRFFCEDVAFLQSSRPIRGASQTSWCRMFFFLAVVCFCLV